MVVSQNQSTDGRNWLLISADCVGFLVRTLYRDRASTAQPHFTVERMDHPDPRPIILAQVSDGLAKAAQYG